MAVNLSPYGGVGAQFLDNAGNVLTGGKIETYAAGTTTPQATYTTSAGNVFHANPIILDASGRVPSGGEIWLTDGLSYKFVLRDSNNVLIATYDNVTGINSNFVNFTNQQEIQTATAGQTVFTLATTNYSPNTNSLSVFVDGVNQYGPGAQYAYLETNSTTVTFVNGLHVGALVKFTTSQLNSSGATTASQVSYSPPFTNSVTTNVELKLAETVSVKDFGAVGDGIVDDTVAIQTAINYVSNSVYETLYFPAGTYKFSTLYCVYDAVNNPGYNVVRNAQISLVGDGIQPDQGAIVGTILSSTVTSGDALIISNNANDVLPFTSRESQVRGMTIKAATSGYVVKAAGVVLPRFYNITIVNSNIAGSGLYISTAFFATLEKIQIKNTGVGTKTGDAIRFDSNISAGLFTMRDANIAGFASGLYKGTGTWQNISIYDSEIAANDIAIYIGAGTLDILNIQGCYFEGVCQSFISVFPTQGLANLTVNASWFLSGGLTNVAINLTEPASASITGCYVLNQYTSFLSINSLLSGYNGGGHFVSGTTFNYTVNPVATVYYFTGYIPVLSSVEYPRSVAFCQLFDTVTYRPIYSRQNFAGNSFSAAGHMIETATLSTGVVAGGSVDLFNGNNVPAFVTTANITSPTTFYLPAISVGLPHGYTITITNDIGSTQTPPIKTAIADGAATLANLAAGTQRKFVYFNDGTITGWR